MIPLHGQVPKGHPPLAVVALALGCAAGFLHQVSLSDAALEAWVRRFGVIPVRTLAALQHHPTDLQAWLAPVFVSPFIHGGLFHLVSNLVFLLAFGRGVEGRLGHGRTLALCTVAAVAAAGTHVAMSPTSDLPMVGASGALSGIMGAYLVMYPFSRITTLIPIVVVPVFVGIPAFVFIGLWLALQILAVTGEGADAGVAWWAHLGGFIAGPLLALLLDPGPAETEAPSRG
ncbi:MAG: rhomboid family intramembrane serine protease [Myxococcales bacterium]|nr:rhomboid family intramembrane serine protease [Myxococcales bacterium]